MQFSTFESLKNNKVCGDTALRYLKRNYLKWAKLVDILNTANRWEEIASRIKKPGHENELFFSVSDIRTLEGQWKRGSSVSPAEAFLDHWSSAINPTIDDLIQLLNDAKLYQAVDTVISEILKVVPKDHADIQSKGINTREFIDKCGMIDRNKNRVPLLDEARHGDIDVSGPLQNHVIHPLVEKEVKPSNSVKVYSYRDLANITGNFCDTSVYCGGFKVGEGAFGTVYRAFTEQWVAVKRLKNAVDEQFFNELEVLTRFKHENLLPLLGYSNDGLYCCLVYAYIENGSLQERLACANGSAPLPWTKRMSIAYYTAKGINHLHIFESQPLVHRDIKSANVLLDKNFIPKVGDFGLVHLGNTGTTSVAFTSNIYGTSVYMAREAFNGEVSIKLDTFSYGVVLMELLTALAPYDPSRTETDLISFMEENCGSAENIITLLDAKAGPWDQSIAVSLYQLSKRCTEVRKKDRPTIAEILPDMEELLNSTLQAATAS